MFSKGSVFKQILNDNSFLVSTSQLTIEDVTTGKLLTLDSDAHIAKAEVGTNLTFDGSTLRTIQGISTGSDPYFATAHLSNCQSGGILFCQSGTTGAIQCTGATTWWLPESVNLYYTDARSRSALTGGIGISYTTGTGLISNIGVLSLTGTSNQITTSSTTGAVTLSLPATISVSVSGATGNFSTLTAGTGTVTNLISTTGSITTLTATRLGVGVAPIIDHQTRIRNQIGSNNPLVCLPASQLSIQQGQGTVNSDALEIAQMDNGKGVIGAWNPAGGNYYDLLLNPGGGSVRIGATGSAVSNADALLQLHSNTVNMARIALTGQEYYQTGYSGTDGNAYDGIGIFLGVNRRDNRQTWMMDTKRIASSGTNYMIRFSHPGGSIPVIDCLTTAIAEAQIQIGNGGGGVYMPGYLGVGTASPSDVIHSSANVRANGYFFATLTSANHVVLNSAGSNYGYILNSGNGVWGLGYGTTPGTLGTSVLSWTSSGYVGIGTTSPTYLFHVKDTTTLGSTRFENNQSNGRYISSVINTSNNATIDFRAHGSAYSETLLGTNMINSVLILGQPATTGTMSIGTYTNSDLTFGTNNAERVRITKDGYVGIGTNAPDAGVSMVNTFSSSSTLIGHRNNILLVGSGGGTVASSFSSYIYPNLNTASATVTNSYGLFIDAGTNNGGTVTTSYSLRAVAPGYGSTKYTAYFDNLVSVGTTPNANQQFYIGGSLVRATNQEAWSCYIDAGLGASSSNTVGNAGSLFIYPAFGSNAGTVTSAYGIRLRGGTTAGTITTGYGLYIEGDPAYGSTKYAMYVAGGTTKWASTLQINTSTNGTVTTSSSNGTLTVTSDIRIKNSIKYFDEMTGCTGAYATPYQGSLELINNLRPCQYKLNPSTGPNGLVEDHSVYEGFIAQDIEQVLPHSVDGKKYQYEWQRDPETQQMILDEEGHPILDYSKPRYRGLSHSSIIAHLVKAMSELTAMVKGQSTKLSEAKAEITELRARIEVLEGQN